MYNLICASYERNTSIPQQKVSWTSSLLPLLKWSKAFPNCHSVKFWCWLQIKIFSVLFCSLETGVKRPSYDRAPNNRPIEFLFLFKRSRRQILERMSLHTKSRANIRKVDLVESRVRGNTRRRFYTESTPE